MKAKHNQTIHTILRQFPYGLYAAGVRGSTNETNAFIASWVTQCSFDPPLIMIAVNSRSESCRLLRKSRVFSLNLLDRSQEDVARLLVKPSRRAGNKLGKINCFQEVTGAPILHEALAFLECRVILTRSPGDHLLAFAEIVNAASNRKGEVMTCDDIGWHYAG